MTSADAEFCVVDASVAIQWVLNEAGREGALRVLDDYRKNRVQLVAPDLLLPECTNVLWKKVRRGEMSASQAETALQFMLLNCPVLVDTRTLAGSALALACRFDRTVYDALYLALAMQNNCELLTADERLVNTIRSYYPKARLLQ